MALTPCHIRPQLVRGLSEARVVFLLGARQTGKSTLVQALARDEHPARYLTLDDPATLELAREDPTGFVAGSERMAIDEIQRTPDLMLADQAGRRHRSCARTVLDHRLGEHR
jgi:predicted AAA+ superfamily ATPase